MLPQVAEGVVKRIKGDRRLVVSITGIACVATCFIHPSLLEPIPENEMWRGGDIVLIVKQLPASSVFFCTFDSYTR